jgi:hypothetical protein
MGKLRELINAFINPVEPEKSLDELAVEAGIEAPDLELLKKSANGLEGMWKFADDVVESKKKKSSKDTTSKETPTQAEPKNVEKESSVDYERD